MTIALASDKTLPWSSWLFSSLQGATFVTQTPRKLGPVAGPGLFQEQTWMGPWGQVEAFGLQSQAYNLWYTGSWWWDGLTGPFQEVMFAGSSNGQRINRARLSQRNARGRSGSSGWENPALDMKLGSGETTRPGRGFVWKDTRGGVAGSQLYKFIPADASSAYMRYSADGIVWYANTVKAWNAVLLDSHNQMLWEPALSKYVVFARGWDPGATDDRFVCRWEVASTDAMADLGIQSGWKSRRSGWSVDTLNATKRVLYISHSDYDVYNPGYIRYAPKAHVMLPTVFRHSTDTQHIGLALSNDGEGWTWADGDGKTTPFIPAGDWRELDCGSMYLWPGYVVSGDKMWLYYMGATYLHAGTLVDRRTPWQTALLRAELRLDGFVACVGGSTAATPITNDITFTGSTLRLNVNAKGGRVRVALCDTNGQAYTGFGFGDCTPIEVDSTSVAVTWSGGSISGYAGTTVRLQFELRDAELYSLQFS